MAHNLFCRCRKCNPTMSDLLFGGTSKKSGSSKKGSFSKKLSDGTTIYGPKGGDKKPGNKHGHYGKNFHRTPHSSIGSAAIGRPHNSKGHQTHRW